jgi:hypothetical protein
MHFPFERKKKTHFSFELHFSFLPYFFEQTTNSKSLHLCPILGAKRRRKYNTGCTLVVSQKKGRLVTPSSATA